ncbi:hypothetical protein D3C76_538200 [compost metagenome]
MKHAAAIERLKQAAEACENNAPIHEAEGEHEQAALDRTNAQAYRSAIDALSAIG